ncbi:hypothetical protein RhiirA5_428557 [Rhizophagus irregularis]|uniref:Uncharacterized protein n=1 Tax=Rhizophagus irregularis TaxID=588596 RepID=A0A2N0P064_9GLOM|nr:hypothetical protein RhiirA5_428557 [Rhizophagus irregularis]
MSIDAPHHSKIFPISYDLFIYYSRSCFNPVTSKRCRHPSNKYLSEGETASKNKKQKITNNLELQRISENNNNEKNKKQRKCKRCEGLSHDSRNCKSKILSERN